MKKKNNLSLTKSIKICVSPLSGKKNEFNQDIRRLDFL